MCGAGVEAHGIEGHRGLRFGRGVHAARISRSVLNVPFQSSIRALMLLHAARRARSSLCGESATRPSSNSRPIGP